MIKIADLTYYYNEEFSNPQDLINSQKMSLGYIPYLKDRCEINVIKHIDHEEAKNIDGTEYAFFKSSNYFFHIPWKTHRYIKKTKPDIILVQGLKFPWQILFLRLAVGRKCKLVVQHHGERPFHGIKKRIQQLANKAVDAYLFTSKGNVALWLNEHIISRQDKCFEVLESATYFKQQDKTTCRTELQMGNENIFLWVGRLATEKDPLTVIQGFEKHLHYDPFAKLYMVYQEDELLSEVATTISSNILLQNAVTLVGKVAHDKLEVWYSAADFFVSGSHREGAGYALIEAMACGCTPVVTSIPTFTKITGSYGFLFSPGNAESAYNAMIQASKISTQYHSKDILAYSQQNLSFKKIADDLYYLCNMLKRK